MFWQTGKKVRHFREEKEKKKKMLKLIYVAVKRVVHDYAQVNNMEQKISEAVTLPHTEELCQFFV